ncbi:MAG: restriction endonuclease, SacI family [Anaerolineae bacterium]|nr:restriction endonuclease, SacI family [Anaerolineae bacterium]
MTSATEILKSAYQNAQQKTIVTLKSGQLDWCQMIVSNAETQKAVLTVVITSLTKKIDNPNQDIRQHKVELSDGYSGRSYDTNYVTPFLQEFFTRYAIAESGWLTRSLEQVHAFTFDFPGKIRNRDVKRAFLEILNDVEVNQADPLEYLVTILALLLEYQKEQVIIAPSFRDRTELTILDVVNMLEQHFFGDYTGSGASRLPVIAIYSLYNLLIGHPRFAQKRLLPLKSHTTSDSKSDSLGDIEITDLEGGFFEVVEVKHGKPITSSMVRVAYEKIKSHPLNRFYLLTTHSPDTEDAENVSKFIKQIYHEHGCEVIVNGLISSVKYYLRLIDNTGEFIQLYTQNLIQDYEKGTDIKKVHVDKWLSLLKE